VSPWARLHICLQILHARYPVCVNGNAGRGGNAPAKYDDQSEAVRGTAIESRLTAKGSVKILLRRAKIERKRCGYARDVDTIGCVCIYIYVCVCVNIQTIAKKIITTVGEFSPEGDMKYFQDHWWGCVCGCCYPMVCVLIFYNKLLQLLIAPFSFARVLFVWRCALWCSLRIHGQPPKLHPFQVRFSFLTYGLQVIIFVWLLAASVWSIEEPRHVAQCFVKPILLYLFIDHSAHYGVAGGLVSRMLLGTVVLCWSVFVLCLSFVELISIVNVCCTCPHRRKNQTPIAECLVFCLSCELRWKRTVILCCSPLRGTCCLTSCVLSHGYCVGGAEKLGIFRVSAAHADIVALKEQVLPGEIRTLGIQQTDSQLVIL